MRGQFSGGCIADAEVGELDPDSARPRPLVEIAGRPAARSSPPTISPGPTVGDRGGRGGPGAERHSVLGPSRVATALESLTSGSAFARTAGARLADGVLGVRARLVDRRGDGPVASSGPAGVDRQRVELPALINSVAIGEWPAVVAVGHTVASPARRASTGRPPVRPPGTADGGQSTMKTSLRRPPRPLRAGLAEAEPPNDGERRGVGR